MGCSPVADWFRVSKQLNLSIYANRTFYEKGIWLLVKSWPLEQGRRDRSRTGAFEWRRWGGRAAITANRLLTALYYTNVSHLYYWTKSHIPGSPHNIILSFEFYHSEEKGKIFVSSRPGLSTVLIPWVTWWGHAYTTIKPTKNQNCNTLKTKTIQRPLNGAILHAW